MPKVTLYTAGNCCYCHMAKDLLRRKGASFEEIDVTGRGDLRADMATRSGRRTVPQIWIDETHVGGCDDLFELEKSAGSTVFWQSEIKAEIMSKPFESSFRAALVQMCAGRSVERNVADALSLISDAAGRGAGYVQTPECTTLMEIDAQRLRAETKPEAANPALEAFAHAARSHGIWLHIGSMGIRVGEGKLANRAYLFDPEGRIAARYDKIHMFDVDLGNGEVYSESANYQAGTQAVLAPLPWGQLGFTICYDLRFPALHRALAKAGATFIAVPAAFTRTTGEAHWHTLLKARAIETQSFVFAAAQCGRHENGRETFGHSLIISPWGKILAEGATDPGVVVADIDTAMLLEIRRKLPSLTHDRTFDIAPSNARLSPLNAAE